MAYKPLTALAALSLAIPHAAAWYDVLPPCLEPFQPFVRVGCYDNGRPGATTALSDKLAQGADMTTEKCVAICKGNDFRYAGLAYYDSCWCGNTVQTAAAAADQCTFPCAGNASETCGGDTGVQLYQDTTFLPVADQTTADYVPLGCWSDNSPAGKALYFRQDQLDAAALTTEKCLGACLAGGYPFAGTEYAGECYCGVVVGNGTAATDEAKCNMPCSGDAAETCGGPGAINMYVAKDLESLQPCGYEPPPSPPATSSTASSTVPAPSPSTLSSSSTVPATSPSTSSASSTSLAPSPSTTIVSTASTVPAPSPSTTQPPMCTSTSVVTVAGKCEFGCGRWCAQPLPEFTDSAGCSAASSQCTVQVASCFKDAGFPDAMNCYKVGEWCASMKAYCAKGNFAGGKAEAYRQLPPVGGSYDVATTVTPCAAAATPTSLIKTTTASATTSVPVPVPTGICKQPTSNAYAGPVGGIALPALTCNNLEADYNSRDATFRSAKNVLKLYTSSDSKACKSYPRERTAGACADACQSQLTQCKDVYAKGCQVSGVANGQSYGRPYAFGGGAGRFWRRDADAAAAVGVVDKRFLFGPERFNPSFAKATSDCQAQYNDCLQVNKAVNANGKCTEFAKGPW